MYIPQALDVPHDPGVLTPHHQRPDEAAVVGHVRTESLSHRLQLLGPP